MISITTGPARAIDPAEDELGRSIVGYSDDMTAEQLYEANHGCWVLGTKADSQQYAILTFQGIVRQAIEIESIDPTSSNRRVINGKILEAGHPVHDAYVGKPSPVGKVRNPITYFDAPVARRACKCGCGADVTKGYFLPGHDQRAIHDRIAKIGSVADFIDWFDQTYTD